MSWHGWPRVLFDVTRVELRAPFRLLQTLCIQPDSFVAKSITLQSL
jgi:hypothetical protein